MTRRRVTQSEAMSAAFGFLLVILTTLVLRSCSVLVASDSFIVRAVAAIERAHHAPR